MLVPWYHLVTLRAHLRIMFVFRVMFRLTLATHTMALHSMPPLCTFLHIGHTQTADGGGTHTRARLFSPNHGPRGPWHQFQGRACAWVFTHDPPQRGTGPPTTTCRCILAAPGGAEPLAGITRVRAQGQRKLRPLELHQPGRPGRPGCWPTQRPQQVSAAKATKATATAPAPSPTTQ